MNLFWTSDLHVGHGNIIRYCSRPFKNAEHMNEQLVKRWNQRVRPGDTVIHIGDFCCTGRERGILGIRKKAREWESDLNGKIIHILGNHDDNNTVKYGFDFAVMSHGGNVIYMVHRPPLTKAQIPEQCDLVLCGHIHNKWRVKFIDDIPVVNVGVDVNKYVPITISEIHHIIGQEKNKLEYKNNVGCVDTL